MNLKMIDPFYLLSVGTPFLVLFIMTLNIKYHQSKRRRSPFTDNFLRSPGESLNNKIQEVSEEGILNLVYVMFIPMFVLIFVNMLRSVQSTYRWLLFAFVLIFIIYYMAKLLRLLHTRRKLLLGYEGELAVGQELNQLMLNGIRVYHDFVTDKFNIDHIIVGSSGVYAIETKTRSKPVSKNGKVNSKVICDGKSLQFLNYIDTNSLDQADRQAKWLSSWLEKAVGNSVRVQPVVALPGWFVERVSPAGIPALNPKMFSSFLKGQKKDVLSENMIQRISHQLEQKCRDIAPKSSRLEKK